MEPITRAQELIKDKAYVKKWFDAKDFFNTFYVSQMLTGDYFITGDDFMGSKIYAARKMTEDGIETIGSRDSKEEAMELVKQHRKENGVALKIVASNPDAGISP